jgi:hypothetical protein
MSWKQSILTIKRNGITMKIPIAFTKTAKVVTQEAEDEYESEEYEDEYLEECPIYLSDDVESEESELDDELGFNPGLIITLQYNQRKILITMMN